MSSRIRIKEIAKARPLEVQKVVTCPSSLPEAKNHLCISLTTELIARTHCPTSIYRTISTEKMSSSNHPCVKDSSLTIHLIRRMRGLHSSNRRIKYKLMNLSRLSMQRSRKNKSKNNGEHRTLRKPIIKHNESMKPQMSLGMVVSSHKNDL